MTPDPRFTFDEVAELYDRHRPGYPEALFEDLVALSGIAPAGRILEIGAGTGQATLPLARRGLRVLCLEPGAALARVARGKLAGFPRVEVLESSLQPAREERQDRAALREPVIFVASERSARSSMINSPMPQSAAFAHANRCF